MSILLVVFLICSLTFHGALGHCPGGWTNYGGSCYFHGHSDMTFQDSQTFCRNLQASLANIETQDENTFVESYLSDLKDPKHWFGLTDEIIEGAWTHFPSGTRAEFLDWGSGQPEQGRSANCAAIWASFNYHWVDEPCTNQFKPLCEKPEADITVQVIG